jgi:hypothetical protein
MNIITLKDFNLGGISDSSLQGPVGSVAEMIGCDIHSEPGFLKVNQKLTKESDGVIDDLVRAIVPCSDGLTYLFGSTNGKIWKRTSAGVYSYVATVAPAAGAVGILSAYEYQGYIYYAMQSRLGRVAVGTPTDWTGRNDSFATFTNTDADFHPMREVNQVLYIGDAHYVAQVNAGTFSANALDIKTPLRVKALGTILTDLVLGTFVSVVKVATEILRWNTWSGSYSVADSIPETGINSFLDTDNMILVNAGRKGNIYSYDGQSLSTFKRIPGNWAGSGAAIVHPSATINQSGLPLFGLSNVSGNPAKQGVYSLGNYDRNYPMVLNLEWLISRGTYENIDIGCLELVETDLLVSWQEKATITMTIADPGVVTFAGHQLSDGDPIKFTTTGALPTGVTAGTVYYAKSITSGTIHLYDTAAHAIAGGSTGRVVTSGTQSGVHTAIVFGVDVLDTSAKVPSASLVTKAINFVRNEGKRFGGFVGYRSLPEGTSIKIYQKANWATEWTEIGTRVDSINKIVECETAMPVGSVVQVKVELNASGNLAPEVDVVELSFN